MLRWQPGRQLSPVEVRLLVMITCRSLPPSTDAGTHVLQRAEAICELLPVQHVGPGDDQGAAGDCCEDRGVGHREHARLT
jgi:hypothetical protein